MNRSDFDRFLATSKTAFGGIGSHFSRMPPDERKAAEDLWSKALEDLSPRLAKAGLEAMVRGDSAKPEYGWSDYPRLIRQAAAQIDAIERATARDEADSRDAVGCPICQDDKLGLVRVWNPWLVESIGSKVAKCHEMAQVRELWRAWHRVDPERRPGGMHLAAICTCESLQAGLRRGRFEEYQQLRGAERAAWLRKNPSPGVVGIYDPGRFCLFAEFQRPEDRLALFGNWYDHEREVGAEPYQEFTEWGPKHG